MSEFLVAGRLGSLNGDVAALCVCVLVLMAGLLHTWRRLHRLLKENVDLRQAVERLEAQVQDLDPTYRERRRERRGALLGALLDFTARLRSSGGVEAAAENAEEARR